MNEIELEFQIDEAYDNHNNGKVIELFESNKSVISKKYHPLNLKYIEALVNNGDLNKAIDLLQEELNMPYIPMDYEDAYKDLYALCINAMKNRDFDRISHYTDDEIIEEVFVKESNISLVILSYLEDKNIRKFLPHIRPYLANPEKENYIKVFLFDVLKKQDVNENFDVASKAGNRIINPTTHHYFDEQVVLSEVFAKLNDCIKDITLLEIIKELSIGLCIGLFPFEFKLEDIDTIIAACHYCGTNMLNNPVTVDGINKIYNIDMERFYLFLDILKFDYKEVGC